MEKVIAETDLAAVLPLGHQHSLLNIINVVLQNLGHLIHVYLPKVLQILLCITASVSASLERRDQVRNCFIKKNLNLSFLWDKSDLTCAPTAATRLRQSSEEPEEAGYSEDSGFFQRVRLVQLQLGRDGGRVPGCGLASGGCCARCLVHLSERFALIYAALTCRCVASPRRAPTPPRLC